MAGQFQPSNSLIIYVGDYYTKFEPFSREKKVARVDFLEASA